MFELIVKLGKIKFKICFYKLLWNIFEINIMKIFYLKKNYVKLSKVKVNMVKGSWWIIKYGD